MGTRARTLVFQATLLLAWLPAGIAHGYITKPALRGGNDGNSLNGYCPHCIGSVDLPMPVCGKSKFLEYTAGPFEKLKAGEMFEVNTKITAPATSSPAPVATPVPPVSTPAPPLSGMTCTATPGLNRGVTDAACAQCASGYKWWPCNEAVL